MFFTSLLVAHYKPFDQHLKQFIIPKTIKPTLLMHDPLIVKLNKFITPQEAQHLIEKARSRLQRSLTVGDIVNPIRTSYTAMFSCDEDDVIKIIAQRAASIVKMPVTHVEGIQIVHYQPGQEFKEHHDYFYEQDLDKVAGQRVFTFFCYLNDLEDGQGGETFFPELNLKVKPEKYTSLFWKNLDEEGNGKTKTLHAGLPPQKGEKWGMNIWVLDRPFIDTSS